MPNDTIIYLSGSFVCLVDTLDVAYRPLVLGMSETTINGSTMLNYRMIKVQYDFLVYSSWLID